MIILVVCLYNTNTAGSHVCLLKFDLQLICMFILILNECKSKL
uniref:Uncharacterized protein n=1 Tax=Arundo donax TaxID=35708 RepID=A0A0A9C1D8_ARUDO